MFKHCLNMEELIKPVVRLGNSACVLLPKSWVDGKAKVELVEKPLDLKKDLFEILSPYLTEVQGIYIVGSYARGEETIESDVDVLVITNTIKKLIKKGKYDITLIPKENVENQLKKNILPLLPMLIEAKSLLNADLLKPYKNTKLTRKNLQFHIETTKSAMNVVREAIKLTKDLNEKKISDAYAYSLILRLRGIYIVGCLIKNKEWNKKDLLKIIKSISGSLVAYKRYAASKLDKKMEDKLPIEEAEKLHDYVVKKIKEQENWIKNEKKEKAVKRN